MYVATVNVSGDLAEGDPAVFDTASEAWAYLAEERRSDEDDMIEDATEALTGGYSIVVSELKNKVTDRDGPGTVYGFTPGGRLHDLGLVYSVSFAEDF